MRFPPPSTKDARSYEPYRIDLQKPAKRELAPGALELSDREVGPMTLGGEPRCMDRADRGAATDVEGSVLQTGCSAQHVQNRAEDTNLVGPSRATSGEHDACDGLGRRQRRRREWSHPRKHLMRSAGA